MNELSSDAKKEIEDAVVSLTKQVMLSMMMHVAETLRGAADVRYAVEERVKREIENAELPTE